MQKDEEQLFELSTGVKLKLSPPNGMVLRARQEQHNAREPRPPLAFNDEKGREEENPMDPDYRIAMANHEGMTIEIMYETLAASGTELVSIPDGFCGPDGEDFIDHMETYGFELHRNRLGRYVQWLKYYAARGRHDWPRLSAALMALVGSTEEEVAEAATMFQRDETRSPDRNVPAEEPT